MKLSALPLLLLLSAVGSASSEIGSMPRLPDMKDGAAFWSTTRVTLSARGTALRAVLAGLLDEAKVPYAIDPSLDEPIYAATGSSTLKEAIGVLSRLAEFDVRNDNGVVFVARRIVVSNGPIGPKPIEPKTLLAKSVPIKPIAPKPIVTIEPQAIKAVVPLPRQSFPVGATPDPAAALLRTVTIAKRRTTLRTVFNDLARQSGAIIALDPKTRDRRMDAVLRPTTLESALTRLCAAAGLRYTLDGGVIRITGR